MKNPDCLHRGIFRPLSTKPCYCPHFWCS